MRKLMWFTIGFTAAIFAGAYVLSAPFYLLAAGVCAVILAICLGYMVRYSKIRIVSMALFGCLVGFSWMTGFDTLYLSVPRAADDMEIECTVYATEYSQVTDFGSSVEGFVKLNGRYFSVKAYLSNVDAVSPGDQISGTFSMGSTLPECSRASRRYRSDGTFLIAYSKDAPNFTKAEKLPWYGYPAYVRMEIGKLIDTSFPADTAPFAKALLLGDTEDLSYEVDTAFKLSGIRHVIAVSGLHVSILFSMVFVLTGRKSWLAALIGIPILVFFAAVAGFSPSITRACIMHGLMAMAMLFKREYDPPTALSFAVLTMLVCNPWTALSVSFQLSVGCMIGIFLFSEPIKNWLMDKKRLGKYTGAGKKLASWFSVSVFISIGAVLITTPLCAYYFGVVSLVSVLTNLLTLWVVTYVFYGILIVCLSGIIFAPIGVIFGSVVAWPIRYILFIAKTIASMPLAAVYTENINIVIWLVISYILLGLFLFSKIKRPVLFACISALTLCSALLTAWVMPLRDECRVTVLDVGQGQCILLQSEGRNYLVDCGGDSETAAADRAAALLQSQGINRLDGLILTHYDRDHAAGAVLLLTRMDADVLYLPDVADVQGYGKALRCYDDGVTQTVTYQTEIRYGNTCITLYPSQTGKTDNESGLCVLFQTENCDILITGDRSADGELELLAQTQLPELELLIVGHHGSRDSTSEALLAQTRPETAIISVSKYNRYGHPTQEVLDRLSSYGCTIYRTDEDGTVIFRR